MIEDWRSMVVVCEKASCARDTLVAENPPNLLPADQPEPDHAQRDAG